MRGLLEKNGDFRNDLKKIVNVIRNMDKEMRTTDNKWTTAVSQKGNQGRTRHWVTTVRNECCSLGGCSLFICKRPVKR